MGIPLGKEVACIAFKPPIPTPRHGLPGKALRLSGWNMAADIKNRGTGLINVPDSVTEVPQIDSVLKSSAQGRYK
jgi:hypothetical protein